MNINVPVECPHCWEVQNKQINTPPVVNIFHSVGVYICKSTECGKEFAVYTRSTIEVKTKRVIDDEN